MMMIEQAKGHPGEPGSQTLSHSSQRRAGRAGCSSKQRLLLPSQAQALSGAPVAACAWELWRGRQRSRLSISQSEGQQ